MTYLSPVSDQRGLAGKPKAKDEIICSDRAAVNAHGLFIDKTKFVKKANQAHVFELTHESSFKPVDGTKSSYEHWHKNKFTFAYLCISSNSWSNRFAPIMTITCVIF
jgi:hypothetical protein